MACHRLFTAELWLVSPNGLIGKLHEVPVKCTMYRYRYRIVQGVEKSLENGDFSFCITGIRTADSSDVGTDNKQVKVFED